jgi:hypothetical protein
LSPVGLGQKRAAPGGFAAARLTEKLKATYIITSTSWLQSMRAQVSCKLISIESIARLGDFEMSACTSRLAGPSSADVAQLMQYLGPCCSCMQGGAKAWLHADLLQAASAVHAAVADGKSSACGLHLVAADTSLQVSAVARQL